jgi:hypothetical protein
VSADQPPQAPVAGSEPAAGTGSGLPRLYFPDEPAVPPPGTTPQLRPGPADPGGSGGPPLGPDSRGSADRPAPPESVPPPAPPSGWSPPPPTAGPPAGWTQGPPAGQQPPAQQWGQPTGQQPQWGQQPGWTPPGSGPGRPQRPARPTAPPRRELRQRAAAAAFFGLLALLALTAANEVHRPLYLVIFSMVIGAGAAVLGISAAVRARKDNTRRPPGSVAAIVLGVISILLAGISVLAIVFARQLSNYEQCMNNASTSAAKQACANQMLQSIQNGR